MAYLVSSGNDIVDWGVKSIVDPKTVVKKMKTEEVLRAAVKWIDDIAISGYWDVVDEIWVELQMTSKYKAIVSTLYARFPDKVKLIAPKKFRHATSKNWGSHALNKQKDIEYVESRGIRWPLEVTITKQKKDDLATVYLMYSYVTGQYDKK